MSFSVPWPLPHSFLVTGCCIGIGGDSEPSGQSTRFENGSACFNRHHRLRAWFVPDAPASKEFSFRFRFVDFWPGVRRRPAGDAYHSVIQQLKQQKHELAAQHLSERRKAKASDTLSSAILADLSCGVLFLNNAGLVRQANAAARDILGFASPVGLHSSDLFRNATLRSENETGLPEETLDQILSACSRGEGNGPRTGELPNS